MTEPKDLLEHAMALITEPESGVAEVHRGLARRQRNRRFAAGAVAVAIWLVIGVAAVALRSNHDTVPAQTPSPTVDGIFSSVGGWIAFQDGDDGQVEAVAPDGSGRTILLDGRRNLWALDWSPDGSRLLVRLQGGCCLRGDLAVIEPDGSETMLAHFDGHTSEEYFEGAAFSPDGETVVYARWRSSGQLWTVASDGSGEPGLLLESEDGEVSDPTYSPDGTRIAYVDGGGDHGHTIRVVNADGTDVRVLVDGPFDHIGHIYGLDWSPDGRLIAVGAAVAGADGIYTVRPDGTDLRLLIPQAHHPAWSTDGSLIAYSPGVSVANADGSDHRMLLPVGEIGGWNPGASADRA